MLSSTAATVDFTISYFIFYFFVFLIVMLVFASFGWSLGVDSWYIYILLKIFEFGRQKIEKKEKLRQKKLKVDDDTEDQEKSESNQSNDLKSTNSVKLAHRKYSLPMLAMANDSCERREFQLFDVANFIHDGIEAIVDDEVTKRFAAEELPSWNLLTRTNKKYDFISVRLTIMWGIGFFIRHFILMPTRVIVTVIAVAWLVICTGIVGCLNDGPFKRFVYWHVSLMCFRIMSVALSAIITYHDKENKACGGGICVANHTSPIDVCVLACDNCYALVGQRQGGFLGVLQRALARATSHIWFERCEIKDRELVTKRLREHVQDPNKLPILIFPEGTCINNSAVMMFKKGSFEVTDKVYPVAIKYDPRFGDPFWNSSRNGYMYYLLLMMTSWAIVCDVWYLPPMTRRNDEDAVEFANRVKAEIAKRGGLVDLAWDGQLKRQQVKPVWKQKQQEEFSKQIKLE